MKNKFIIYTCFLAIISTFSSCSINDITVDKTTGEKKSFLMINNNIIKINELIKINKDEIDYNYGLYGACEGGHIKIIDMMIEKGANDWNSGLYIASITHNSYLTDFFQQKLNQ